jgi:hypothetical protein
MCGDPIAPPLSSTISPSLRGCTGLARTIMLSAFAASRTDASSK